MRQARGTSANTPKARPASNPDARENQLIALAVDNAEKQLREGTASSQIICHYLKRAAEKEKSRIELEILQEEKKLMQAKTAALNLEKENGQMVAEALAAFRGYRGEDPQTGESEDDEYY